MQPSTRANLILQNCLTKALMCWQNHKLRSPIFFRKIVDSQLILSRKNRHLTVQKKRKRPSPTYLEWIGIWPGQAPRCASAKDRIISWSWCKTRTSLCSQVRYLVSHDWARVSRPLQSCHSWGVTCRARAAWVPVRWTRLKRKNSTRRCPRSRLRVIRSSRT